MNIEERPRAAGWLWRNHLKTVGGKTQARDEIVADDLYLGTERLETFDHPLYVTRSTARLCARSRRRAEINNSHWFAVSDYERRAFRFRDFLLES